MDMQRTEEERQGATPCKWWKLVYHRMTPKYNGSYSTTTYECTKPIMCKHNVGDEKMGGCQYRGYPPEEGEA